MTRSSGGRSDAKSPDDRRRLIRLKRSGLLSSPLEMSVNYDIALSRQALEESFRLVYQAYEEVGLQAPNDAKIRFTPHHPLPTTKVFVADYCPDLVCFLGNADPKIPAGQVVGTVTLVLDSGLGLPMEEVCRDEVMALRRDGARLAEVIALSVHPTFRQNSIIVRLYKVMVEYAMFAGVTHLGCAVMKHHHPFYRDMLLFEPIGELKSYAKGNGLEVQGHMLPLQKMPARYKEVYGGGDFETDLHAFFTRPTRTFKSLLVTPWSSTTQNYFFRERTDLPAHWDEKTLAALRAEYARVGCPFIL
jgi:hypothetical protein